MKNKVRKNKTKVLFKTYLDVYLNMNLTLNKGVSK